MARCGRASELLYHHEKLSHRGENGKSRIDCCICCSMGEFQAVLSCLLSGDLSDRLEEEFGAFVEIMEAGMTHWYDSLVCVR